MASEAFDRLRGQRQTGGKLSRLRFSHALGLEKAPPAFAIRVVSWIDDHLEVLLGVGPGKQVILEIVEQTGGLEGLAATEHLVLRYRGDEMPRKLAKRLAAAFQARLGPADLARIAGSLAEDPELREGLPAGLGGGDRTGPPPSSGGAPAVDDEVGEHEKQLKGARRAGGQTSRIRFDKFLGLDDAPPPFGVSSLGWFDDHIELGVETDEGRDIRFAIFRRDPEIKGFVTTPKLVITYQAKDIPDFLAETIGRVAPQRLHDLGMNDLAGVLLDDLDLGSPGEAMPSADNDRPDNLLDTWGGEDSYADFFAGGEIARGQLDSVDISRFSRNVQHCDLECLFVNPHANAQVVTMVDFPWEDRVRNIGVPMAERVEKVEKPWDPNDSMVATDLGEQDVILGAPEKLRAVMEQVVKRPNPEKKPLFVANTCVPTVTGEDVESIVKEFRKKTDFPILYLTVTPKSMNDVLVDLLVNTRLKAEASAGDPDPHSVNLIGFTEGRALGEVELLLGAVGIRVNTRLLPALEVEILEALPRGALNIVYPNSLWNHLYEQVQRDSRIPSISPPAPFGFEGSRAWLKAVVDALGLQIDFEARWAELCAAHEEGWAQVQERCPGNNLGMVLRGEELQYILDPSQTWGIPVAGMAQEMGFGLEVFLAARNEKAAERLGKQILPLLDEAQGSKVVPFSSFAEMREVLAASECGALLTNHFFDWRVGEAGKNRFSLQHFEMGLAGAVRTGRRLLQVQGTPFFRKYGRYLHRTTEGIRDPLHEWPEPAPAPEDPEGAAQKSDEEAAA
ncbi:MAG: nitrogenase component 1 [Deltaproteobacteria bacterium]|nr:nitrogenase component 1 [Deltaproteobacteria bacterium]